MLRSSCTPAWQGGTSERRPRLNFRATSTVRPINVDIIQRAVEQAARLSVEQSALIVLEEAEAIVPFDTGELRESGHTEIAAAENNTVTGKVIFDAEHAGFVEFGTGIRGASSAGAGPGPYSGSWPGMTAQPYLRPALDTARPAILEVFRDNVEAATKIFGK